MLKPAPIERLHLSPCGQYAAIYIDPVSARLKGNLGVQIFYIGTYTHAIETERERYFDDEWMQELDSLGKVLREYLIHDLCKIVFGYAQDSFTCVNCGETNCIRELDALDNPVLRMQVNI